MDSDRIDREGKIPPEVIQGLRDIGAFGIKIPQEYGGLGLSQTAYTHAIGMVTSVDGNLTALLSAAQSIGVPQPLKLFGTPEQKRRYLPRLAQGRRQRLRAHRINVGSDPAAHAARGRPLARTGRTTSSTARSSGAPTARSPS